MSAKGYLASVFGQWSLSRRTSAISFCSRASWVSVGHLPDRLPSLISACKGSRSRTPCYPETQRRGPDRIAAPFDHWEKDQ